MQLLVMTPGSISKLNLLNNTRDTRIVDATVSEVKISKCRKKKFLRDLIAGMESHKDIIDDFLSTSMFRYLIELNV